MFTRPWRDDNEVAEKLAPFDIVVLLRERTAFPRKVIEALPALKAAGCLFITAAVESVDDQVLQYLAKNHTRADFERALQLCRDAGIGMAPTFVVGRDR